MNDLIGVHPLLRFLCYIIFPVSAIDGTPRIGYFGRLKRIPYAWSGFLLYATWKFTYFSSWPYMALRDEKPQLWGFLDILLRILSVHAVVQFFSCHFARVSDMASSRMAAICGVALFPTYLIIYPWFWEYIPHIFCTTVVVTALVPSRKDEDSQTDLTRTGDDQ